MDGSQITNIVIALLYLVVFAIFMPVLRIINKVWRQRLALDERELAIREKEIEQREQLLPLLDGVSKEAMREALAQYAPALLLDIETEAREKAEAMHDEVRKSIQRAYDET